MKKALSKGGNFEILKLQSPLVLTNVFPLKFSYIQYVLFKL